MKREARGARPAAFAIDFRVKSGYAIAVRSAGPPPRPTWSPDGSWS